MEQNKMIMIELKSYLPITISLYEASFSQWICGNNVCYVYTLFNLSLEWYSFVRRYSVIHFNSSHTGVTNNMNGNCTTFQCACARLLLLCTVTWTPKWNRAIIITVISYTCASPGTTSLNVLGEKGLYCQGSDFKRYSLETHMVA